MFDHVTIRAGDRAASERFYATVLGALDVEPGYSGEQFAEWDDFSLAQATATAPPTRGLHIGFVAPSRAHVDAFWQSGVAAGYTEDGKPGLRTQYRGDYYGAFLLDPDGNSAEAVHHGALRHGGVIDHLWMRVRDVAAAKAFYATIAPAAGLRLGTDTPERVSFRGSSGSFSVVGANANLPTANVHLAFAASDDERVRRFHAEALAAGHRDNGAPGERPQYHAGYHAAFVLDPDGHNVEVVNHHRG